MTLFASTLLFALTSLQPYIQIGIRLFFCESWNCKPKFAVPVPKAFFPDQISSVLLYDSLDIDEQTIVEPPGFGVYQQAICFQVRTGDSRVCKKYKVKTPQYTIQRGKINLEKIC